MSRYATTKMSSKGQVVIPEEIRESLHLKEGAQFVVLGQGDTVVLKSITPPSMDEFKSLLREVRAKVKKAGLKKRDVDTILAKVRRQQK